MILCFMLYLLSLNEYKWKKLSSNNIDGFLQFENVFIILRNVFFLYILKTETLELGRRYMKTLKYHL